MLRQNTVLKGVHPLIAFGLFTDPDVRKRRDDAVAQQTWIWNRLEIVKRRLARFNRLRLSGNLQGQPSDEEAALRDELEELQEKKEWADIEADVAHKGLMGDFYAKLEAGVLVAVSNTAVNRVLSATARRTAPGRWLSKSVSDPLRTFEGIGERSPRWQTKSGMVGER